MRRIILIEAILLFVGACSTPEIIEEDFTEAQYGIEMIYVQGGTFLMGCTPGQEDDCDEREKPAHEVTVGDFYIGKYEVTQKQWREIMGIDLRGQLKIATGIALPLSGKNEDHPMYYVSWEDTREFIERLNEKTDKNYRLPTEAEWEYAARGGNQSRGYKYSGSNDIGAVSWYSDNSKSRTHPVGTKEANELGIHDMNGNVNEWVSDWYVDYSDDTQVDPSVPELDRYPYRVFRGGSWFNGAWYARVSYRNAGSSKGRTGDMGFRLALSSNSKQERAN